MRFKPTILLQDESDLHLPRVLCLHGGGTNARIFHAQCRGILKHLHREFRFVFAQAPFPSVAGPDVLSVYKEWGPFRRWLESPPDDSEFPSQQTVIELDRALEDAMHRDTMRGATGNWVGVMGFSQGAKLAASLLYRQQEGLSKTNFRFGILLAGSAPLAILDQDWDLQAIFKSLPKSRHPDAVLSIPTIHVHGCRDAGLHRHRQLYKSCQQDTARLVEWDGNHRVPIKSKDLLPLVQQIREVSQDAHYGGTSFSVPLDFKPSVSCLEVEV
ncbi:uncharacterized protein N7496_005645 [Penicillium cataractarum]|uniref:Serine hydrolase domain-containing protein n=1 Tax=Penicillium cataractarum TaxID=2100454 RepID=A0A9W9VG87_9EURO|nr:uncharacterized protein N7496_005645 [Penicillium cataractarum]KAJ5378236.1 hypothetical protein N7496_005645 [Penicillium cataractarum]